ELLADAGTAAKVVNGIDKDGRSALHYACLNDDIPLLTVLLADDRVDVGLRTPKGDTCLHLGALYASLESLKRLFADPRGSKLLNEQNQWGETPLHLCAGSGDKGAGKAAALLLEQGASMTIVDKWKRGPMDVAHDNGENPLVAVFDEFLDKHPAKRAEVEAVTAAYKAHVESQNFKPAAGMNKNIFSQLGGALKGLKKVSITEKQMFAPSSGTVTKAKGDQQDARSTGKVLSKMIDFPGDLEEIKGLLADDKVDPGGKDAYGLTALMKFASWNKTEFIALLLPHLSPEQINAQDPEGKTALHWACEMASVAAVSALVACAEVDPSIKDAKGRTPLDIVNSGQGAVIERLRKALQPK
ncbi:Ankyrin repeat domain-containing protein 6 (Diversin), partial [Durusdinium trenchii]